MNSIKDWFLKNWGNVFSALGLIAAIYIGIFYVPSYVKEALTEKQSSIHNDLLQATKELVYSDSITTIQEIETLIKGKEVKFGVKYIFTTKQLLLQTQDAFMEHKFLPLDKRKKLIAEIEDIKNSIKVEPDNLPSQKDNKSGKGSLISLLSIFITIVATLLGLISSIYKLRQERFQSEEIKNQVEAEKQEGNEFVRETAHKYEYSIIEEIKDKLGIDTNQVNEERDGAIDYKFEYDKIQNYLYVKYLTKSKIGLGSIQSFFSALKGRKGNAILVYNTDFTTMVTKEIEKFRDQNPETNLILIKAVNGREFKTKFKKELIEKKAKA